MTCAPSKPLRGGPQEPGGEESSRPRAWGIWGISWPLTLKGCSARRKRISVAAKLPAWGVQGTPRCQYPHIDAAIGTVARFRLDGSVHILPGVRPSDEGSNRLAG
jgi:hypothetical protein